MGATGLFLCIFLIVHLSGNLMLLIPPENGGQLLFNRYADFMSSNFFIRILSLVLYFSIIAHVVNGIILEYRNRRRRPAGYSVLNASATTTIMARNMGPLGVLILIFLVIHLKNFWWEFRFGELGADPHGYRDLYTLCMVVFSKEWYVVIYVVSMIFLWGHLAHGALSQFISLGVYHKGFHRFMEKFRYWFATIICGGFALIPVWVYVREVLLKG